MTATPISNVSNASFSLRKLIQFFALGLMEDALEQWKRGMELVQKSNLLILINNNGADGETRTHLCINLQCNAMHCNTIHLFLLTFPA